MMRDNKFILLITMAVIVFLNSCTMLEKASNHGFNSGYYTFESGEQAQKVYAEVTEETIDLYHRNGNVPDKERFLSVPVATSDTLLITPLKFKKQSLDIDITTILLKYRPSVHGLPQQLTSDFNAALYAGWRFDNYKLTRRVDPLGKSYHKVTNLGYDFGFFAGPGTTQITPFTTLYRSPDEYSGMIFQTGIAGFLETNMASFGIAVGFDYLLNQDRAIWIYNHKPWLGFIVGIALN